MNEGRSPMKVTDAVAGQLAKTIGFWDRLDPFGRRHEIESHVARFFRRRTDWLFMGFAAVMLADRKSVV